MKHDGGSMHARRWTSILFALICLSSPAVARAGMTQDWIRTYDAITGHDIGRDVAVDADGSVVVTGSSLGFVQGFNYTYEYGTVKYDPSGNLLWTARYNGPGGSFNDEPVGVEIDSDGSVCVSGSSPGGATDLDIATVKYDADGTELWVRRWNSPANRTDAAVAMAMDGAGNVYVTGHSYSPANVTDMITLKYDRDGNLLWEAMYGAGFGTDISSGIALGPNGSVYVTGESIRSGGFYDWATVKYDTNGNQEWVAFVDGPSHSHDYAYAIAVDALGNAYVTGYTVTNGNYTLTAVAYASNGAQLWLNYAQLGEVGSTIALDASANMLIGCWGGLVVSYDSSGTERWTYDFGGADPGRPTASLVDGAGNWYLTGYATVPGQRQNYHTVKLDPNGSEQWTLSYNNPANWDDSPAAFVRDFAGNLIVTGSTDTRTANDLDYCTIRYIPDTVGVPDANSLLRVEVSPQPVIDTATLRFQLPGTESATMDFVDASGRVLETVTARGSASIEWRAPASGVYWARLRSRGQETATKFTVLR